MRVLIGSAYDVKAAKDHWEKELDIKLQEFADFPYDIELPLKQYFRHHRLGFDWYQLNKVSEEFVKGLTKMKSIEVKRLLSTWL